MRPRLKRVMWIAPLAIAGLLAFIAIGGLVVSLLWNWLLPPLFGWRAITFWQAVGLLALCRILFGGFGGHRPHRHGIRGRIADRISDRMADRWEHMSPEERERFRQGLRARCGFEPPPGESSSQGQ